MSRLALLPPHALWSPEERKTKHSRCVRTPGYTMSGGPRRQRRSRPLRGDMRFGGEAYASARRSSPNPPCEISVTWGIILLSCFAHSNSADASSWPHAFLDITKAITYYHFMSRTEVRKAIIPAAGLGTRFLPATKASPKEMLPLVDKPLIQYAVEEAVASGIEDIIVVTGRGKRAIEDHFDRSVELEENLKGNGKAQLLSQMRHISNLANFCYVRQSEALGLGHAVLCAQRLIGDEPFAVILGENYRRAGRDCAAYSYLQRRNGAVLACRRFPIQSHRMDHFPTEFRGTSKV